MAKPLWCQLLRSPGRNPGHCTSSGLLWNLTQLVLPSLHELEDPSQSTKELWFPWELPAALFTARDGAWSGRGGRACDQASRCLVASTHD